MTTATIPGIRTASRTIISKDQALEFHTRWSDGDRLNVRMAVDHILAVGYYLPPTNGYVGVLDINGRVIAYLCPGYVAFTQGRTVPWAMTNEDGTTWFALTTWRQGRAGVAMTRK